MRETEDAPEAQEQESEERDTPIDQVPLEKAREMAEAVVCARQKREAAEADEEAVARVLLPLMEQLGLNGIVLPDGWKVRRRSKTTFRKVEPVKLAERLADATDYIRIETTVDITALARDYPNVALELGHPKRTEFVQVAKS